MKYYAVRNGHKSGVYNNWSDCESQVKGYSGNQYKSFNSRAEANAYMNSGSNSNSSRSSYGSSSSSSGSGSRSRSSYSNSSSSSRAPYSNSSSRSSYGSSYSSSSSYTPSYSSSSSSSSSSSRTVNIYTDGASKNNQGAKQGKSTAGFGVYYGPGDSRNYSGRVTGEQTNNRGELYGIHKALKNSVEESKSSSNTKYFIHTDSQYSKDAITKWGNSWEKNGWKTSTGSDVINQDVIKECRDMVRTLKSKNVDVEIVKVKGHSGNHGNDQADKLAVEGCSK